MILVTGASGFIGKAVVRALVARGEAVRALSRRPAEPGARVETAVGDLCEPASLGPALAGVDTVVHLAAVLGSSGASAATLRAANVEGTRALALAARAAGVARFIHGSSAGVYGDGDGRTDAPHAEAEPPAPGTAYEVSKRDAEDALREALDGSAVRWTILRPCGVYGPGRPATLAFCREVLARRVWVHGPAAVLLHPTYVEDVVGAVIASLEHPEAAGEVINVAGERSVRYDEYVALFAARLGAHPVQIRAVGAAVRVAATPAAALFRALGRPAPPALARLARRFVNRAIDVSKARRLLGYSPIPLDRGIELTVDWARKEGLRGGR